MKLTIVEKNLLSWTAMHIDFVMCKNLHVKTIVTREDLNKTPAKHRNIFRHTEKCGEREVPI